MKTVIFDLDHTLLNTNVLKEKICEILEMSEEEFDKSYRENFTSKGVKYSFEDHLRALRDVGSINSDIKLQALRKKFDEELSSMDHLLYDGALDLVLSEKAKGNKVILITLGKESWQKEKINRLGSLKGLFDEICYEEKDKAGSDYLVELSRQDGDFVIINDNIGETKKMVSVLNKEGQEGEAERCEVKIVKGIHSEKESAEESGYQFFEEVNNIPRTIKEPQAEAKHGFAIK
ncbi:hypothetical protein C0584_00590 [Candidatus Parcubacteria bacterium]|nr:MAG: hypothetical protein C0584_00590 [Candidatus Parcubacteria bacterium]